MASNEARLSTACERLQASRIEIFALARVIRGDRELEQIKPPTYRSRLMRALTGESARTMAHTVGRAALAMASTKPRAAGKLSTLLPLLRPVLTHYLVQILSRQRKGTTAP